MSSGRRNRRGQDESQQEPANAPSQGAVNQFQGFVASCSVCLSEFSPGHHVCRLMCGHACHCMCVGKLAVRNGASFESDGTMAVECPCCRQQAQVRHAWHYPRVASAEPTNVASAEPSAANPGEQEQRPDEPGNQTPQGGFEVGPLAVKVKKAFIHLMQPTHGGP